jgi:CO dehydrogenase maturation factor
MKIAVCGKGGVGKTTVAGALAWLLHDRGFPVLAIDADSNPNLAISLGIPPEEAVRLPTLPSDLLERRVEPDGRERWVLARPLSEILATYGIPVRDRLTLLLMGGSVMRGRGECAAPMPPCVACSKRCSPKRMESIGRSWT